MLTKIFLSKQAHKTEQKTYLHFFYSWHGSFANSIFLIFALRLPFKSVTFIWIRCPPKFKTSLRPITVVVKFSPSGRAAAVYLISVFTTLPCPI